jgi:hypothetical protein
MAIKHSTPHWVLDKTNFDDGGSEFLQNTSNLNVNKHFANVMQGLNLGFGGEYRATSVQNLCW